MANKSDSLKQYVSLREALLAEKNKLEARLHSINQALGGSSKVAGGTLIIRKKPFLSPAARARIAAAQKTRWAKVRAAKAAAAKK